MATGPEHYRKAERLLAEITMGDDIVQASDTAHYIAAAQAHATLALAAATAMSGRHIMHDFDYEAWDRVAGVQEDGDDDKPCARCGEYGHTANDCKASPEPHSDRMAATSAHYGGQPCPGCPDCTGYPDYNEPDDEDDDESRFTRAQLDGDACTECGTELAEGQPTVASAYDPIEGQLFAHLSCIPDDEPMTNRDVDPEHVAECDADADAYADTPMYDGTEATR
jgi:hypothetical protein